MASGNSMKIVVFVLLLIAVVVAIAALVISVILYVNVANQKPATGGTGPPCLCHVTDSPPAKKKGTATKNTTGWKNVAKMLGESIDLSVDPCEDFYQFACGNWMRSHAAPAVSFSSLSNEIVNQLTKEFQKKVAYDKNSALGKAQIFWNSCVGINSSYDGTKQILNIINSYGGWPMLNASWTDASYKGLPLLMAQLTGHWGVNTFISPFIDTNWKHPSEHMMFIDQTTLFYPAIYYQNTEVWKETKPLYKRYMTKMVKLLANDSKIVVNDEHVNSLVDSILQLEWEIADFTIPAEQLRNYTKQWNPFTVQQLNANTKWNSFNWTQYFEHLAWVTDISTEYFSSSSKNKLSILETAFQDKLHPFLNKQKPSTIQNYMIWRLIAPHLRFLPGAYRDAYTELQAAVENKEPIVETPAMCTAAARGLMGFAVGQLYINKIWSKTEGVDAANDLKKMITHVLGSFHQMIKDLTWMQDSTKPLAYAKIDHLVQNVANPSWIMNSTGLDMYYKNITVSKDGDFFDMLKMVSWFNVKKQFQQLQQKTDRSSFGNPAIVNAWYQPELNSITFPAGILNPPFFSRGFPTSVNYGGIGVVMGHELTHGFDDEGVQWNATGFMKPWMDDKSRKGFESMAKCVIDEYSSFCFKNMTPSCISGSRTQGENIADNGGIKAAWHAYKNIVQEKGEEPRLPNWMQMFTHDQLFFLSFAQVWCRNVKTPAIKQQLLIDPHSPARYRVEGTVRNVPEFFGPAFNCRKGSRMVPKKHCNVW